MSNTEKLVYPIGGHTYVFIWDPTQKDSGLRLVRQILKTVKESPHLDWYDQQVILRRLKADHPRMLGNAPTKTDRQFLFPEEPK